MLGLDLQIVHPPGAGDMLDPDYLRRSGQRRQVLADFQLARRDPGPAIGTVESVQPRRLERISQSGHPEPQYALVQVRDRAQHHPPGALTVPDVWA